MIKKSEVDRFVRKRLPVMLENEWASLNLEQKEKMFDFATQLFYDEVQEAQEDLDRIHNLRSSYKFLFLGVYLGIFGGLVANLLTAFFSKYSTYYALSVFVLFIILNIYLLISLGIRTRNIFESNKNLMLLTEEAEKKIEENKK